jgi:RNA polymerase sigma factor for flagellar operon FliA
LGSITESTASQAARSPSSHAALANASSGSAASRTGASSLTPELAALWQSYRENVCDQTRNSLVEAYQSFVRDVTRRFASRLPRSVDRGDLETAANVGLMAAVAAFDPERGVRFESYCELRVKGALLDELRTQDWLPRPWRHRLEQQKRALERLRSQLGREPGEEEVAAALEMPLQDYRQAFGVGLPGVPAGGMPTEDTGDDTPLSLDVVPDQNADAPGDRISRSELFSLITQRLTDQEYRILYLRYWEGLAMREIGELLKVSESRVCKIHARLIGRLKDRFRDDHEF